MTQPSISHHLDILKRAGLAEAEKRGREVYYRLSGASIIECCGEKLSLFDIKLIKLQPESGAGGRARGLTIQSSRPPREGAEK